MRDCMPFVGCYLHFCRYAICGYAICAGDAGDEAISKSYKCMDLSPVDGSSVRFLSSER